MTDLSAEQVYSMLRTRGFSAGGFRSPLRWFRGTLTGIRGTMEQFGQMQEARLQIHYDFQKGDLEVFESTEPYQAPVAQISIWHSNSPTSAMGVLGKSIDNIINAGVDDTAPQEQVKNQDFLLNKVQEWKVTPGHPVFNRDANSSVPTDCWEVVFVEGVGGTPYSGVTVPSPAPAAQPTAAPTTAPAAAAPTGVTAVQQAINLLDGKTQQQWNNVVFQDPIVKTGGGDLVNYILSGEFVGSMEAAGVITKDENGVYHKTQNP